MWGGQRAANTLSVLPASRFHIIAQHGLRLCVCMLAVRLHACSLQFDETDSECKRETNEKKPKIENELAKAQEMRQADLIRNILPNEKT